MKNLILVRHAKSSWEAPLGDIDRPLLQRGVSDAGEVALASLNYIPRQFNIWSSKARRARDTALIFAKELGFPAENIFFKDELYTFDHQKLEQIIKTLPADYNNMILFGHNEAITNFVNKFGDVFITNVPTSGFVSIQFDCNDWQSIDKGITLKTIFPKDLK